MSTETTSYYLCDLCEHNYVDYVTQCVCIEQETIVDKVVQPSDVICTPRCLCPFYDVSIVKLSSGIEKIIQKQLDRIADS